MDMTFNPRCSPCCCDLENSFLSKTFIISFQNYNFGTIQRLQFHGKIFEKGFCFYFDYDARPSTGNFAIHNRVTWNRSSLQSQAAEFLRQRLGGKIKINSIKTKDKTACCVSCESAARRLTGASWNLIIHQILFYELRVATFSYFICPIAMAPSFGDG